MHLGISYDEIEAWLKCKSSSGPSWKIVINNRSVFKSAHKFASVHRDKHAASVRDSERIFGLEAFKLFLIHLFVLSILWVHFEHADEWEEGHDTGNRCLNLDEFKMACRTFMHSHANEEVDNEKIAADFNMLDTDGSGAVDFSEVWQIYSLVLISNSDYSNVVGAVRSGVHLLLEVRGCELRVELPQQRHARLGARQLL